MIRLNGRNLGSYPELRSIRTEKRSPERYTLLSEDLPILRSQINYCADGSTAYCTDTKVTYVFDNGEWTERTGGDNARLEEVKSITITENGTIEITPSDGYDGVKKITVTVNVEA